ncbi:MAG: DUF2330 domain-containing protein [Deltaproteobacteria bacterium]|nr:DUF2330 domain-containing protein [Deltaproteobacteria bacterium]
MLRRLLALFTFAALLALGAAAPASACGGFFSDSSAAVVQQAERILFSKNADGTLTAIVEIQYAGPSERFAWILPVPGVPDVGVSSNVAFDVLAEATAPSYQLTTRSEGSCREGPTPPPVDASTPTLDASDADAGPGPVRVLGEGSVGPFDWVLISPDVAAPDPADAALTWLTDNGYDATSAGRELLGPYLAEGMNLIAFRLTKQATVGDIQPIRLTYAAPRPEIPIKLTAVASAPDMPVLVWVLGETRAVPTNYLGLQLNDALIDWFTPSSSYDAVVGAAADEAGGQGFVTEMAGRTSSLPSLLSDAQSSWARSARADTSRTDRALVADAVAVFAAWDGLIRVARDHVPLASGQTPTQALSCIRCEESAADCAAVCPAGGQDLSGFDRAAFIDAIESEVVAPVRDADALMRSRPYVTRFYTNLSAAEMTLDPDFDFNPSLPDVSNVHRAERVIECTPAVYSSEAPSSVILPDGRVVRVAGGAAWPFTPRASMPANRVVERLATRGAAVTVRDNAEEIDRVLSAHNAEVPAAPIDLPDGGFPDGGVGDAGDAGDAGRLPPDYVEGACSVDFGARRGAGTSFVFALLLATIWLRRRR